VQRRRRVVLSDASSLGAIASGRVDVISPGALLTSAGRRVELLRLLQRRVRGPVVGGDLVADAPAALLADEPLLLPRVQDPSYVDVVLGACVERGLVLVVPTIDPELEVLARQRKRFADAGVYVAVGAPAGVADSFDKAASAVRLACAHIAAVPTARWLAGQAAPFAFPVVVKPSTGSSGVGVRTIANASAWTDPPAEDWLVQPFVDSSEVTVDVITDEAYRVLALGARRRLKVRGGEVERGVTVHAESLLELAAGVARAFTLEGPWNFQVFDGPAGWLVAEVNARFAGGMPLSEQAGAGLVDLVVTRAETGSWPNVPPRLAEPGWRMTRYDMSVFLRENDLPW